MTKKTGRRYEVELDWYYISKDSLRRWILYILLALAVAGAGYFVLRPGPDNVAARATREVAAAGEMVDKAQALPEASRIREELDAASAKLEQARGALKAGKSQEAVVSAVEAQSIAKRLLGGLATFRGDATILDTGGRAEVQRAARSTWEAARVGMRLYEGDFIKTGANGGAHVMASDGTMYRISAETLFEVHRSTVVSVGPEADKRRSEIKFIVGTVDVNTGEGSRSIVRTDAATANIASRSSVGLDVDKSKSTGLSTYRGEATLSTQGASVTLRERERAVASGGTGLISEKVHLPETPRLLRPEDNVTFDARKKEPIHIGWSAAKEATRYRLQIAQSRLFIPDTIIVDLADRTRTEATVTVNEEGAFFWRVAALGKGNLSSEWSAARKFKVLSDASRTTGPDTVPPDLVVQRPQVNGTLVIVTGRTEPGATVTVNGEPADTDAAGSFKKIISVAREGLNTIEVRAVDGAGNQTVRRENVVIQIF